MDHSQNPIARQEKLVIQEMPEEVLVYDLESNKAHCLNQTAAFVWKFCDGRNSVAQIAARMERQTGKEVQKELVWLALDQLNERNLLSGELPVQFQGRNRRAVLKKIGLAAAVALPIVASLTAPTAALAVACTGVVPPSSCVGCNPGTPCFPASNGGGNGTCKAGGACTTP